MGRVPVSRERFRPRRNRTSGSIAKCRSEGRARYDGGRARNDDGEYEQMSYRCSFDFSLAFLRKLSASKEEEDEEERPGTPGTDDPREI